MSIVTPSGLSPSAECPITMDITIGIMAEERAVADANPRWIKIRKAAIIAIKRNTLAVSREKAFTNTCASQVAAFVLSNTDPRPIPAPNMTIDPQSMFGCANFQSIIPILGKKNKAIAMIVVVVVSMECSLPPVAHNANKPMEMHNSFFSSNDMGPISLRILASWTSPPTSSLNSGLIKACVTK